MLLVALAAVLLVAGGIPTARAEDDDEQSMTLDQKLLHNLMTSLGLSRDRPAIEYRERSPLVVPPRRDLPPPETDSAATKNPAWPVDAGEKRRKDALREKQRKNFDSAIDDGRVLTRDEMERDRRTARGSDGARRTEDVDQTMLKPYEMGPGIFSRLFKSSKEETATFTGEPPRTSLTEPPTGYRTPSSAQPYGLGQKALQAPLTPEQQKSKYGTNE
jgi:hypothetical protein